MNRGNVVLSELGRKPTSNGVTNAVHNKAIVVATSHHMRNLDCGEIVVRPIRSICFFTRECASMNVSRSPSVGEALSVI